MHQDDEAWADIDSALAPVHEFAKTLVGLPLDEATNLANDQGYDLAIDCKVLDISLTRIRIEVDADNKVTVATAG